MNNTVVRVLLVEDSVSDADVLQEMLHQTGLGSLEFTWVERLDEALSRLCQETFDVLLLDLSLPDSTGSDTFLRVRNAAPQVPIVVLTGVEDEHLGLEAVRHGVQDYLVKGRADDRQVARAIRYAIERNRGEEAIRRSQNALLELIERSPFGTYIVDSQFRIAQMNTASQNGAFRNVRPVVGRDFAEAMRILWPEPVAAEIIGHFRHTLETGEPYYSPRFINPRRDAAIVESYEWELHRMTLPDGQYGVICYYYDSTKLRETEAALRRAKEEWERTFDSVPDMIAIMDDRHRILRANRAMAERLGCTPEECIGEICYECVHGTNAPPALCPHVRMLVDGQGHSVEIHEERLGGDFMVSTTPLLDDRGERTGAVHVARDITERKKREDELNRLNRTLKALGRSNQALIRAGNETEFLNEACRIIVEDCGHSMVWIGYAEEDEARSVRPMAYAGFEEGYLETLKVTWADTERGHGPTGTAIRTGKPCACPDMLTDPKFAPWREEAVNRGYASSLVLPLLTDGKAFGAITIYFRQTGVVSEHELRLLTELADDVAYGIGIMRLREAHSRAEAAMRSSEERLATFAAATFEGIILSDDGHIVDCNEQFAQMVGCGPEELKGVAIGDLIVPEDRERVMENIQLGRESLVEHGMLRKDGTRIVVEAHGRALSATASRQRHTAVRDITARKQAEEALRQARDQLEQRVLERTTELRATYEELKSAMTEQRRLEAEILEISNSERQRIGQDLHDGLTQHLNGILYMSETLRQRLIEHLTVKPSELARLTDLLRDGVTQSRDLAYGLNPVGVEPDGLVVALKRFAVTVRETFKIPCRLEDSQPITLRDDKVATHLYRIAQESVQNAIKHGKATRVMMKLRETDNLITFEVRDNGVGLADGVKAHSGMGLHIMRYRARACGGSLIVRKGPRGGTWVICSVPRIASEEGQPHEK
jgi:PAS domain S-box-containing protein